MSSFLTINSLFILHFLIFSTFFSSIYCVLFKEFHMPLVEKRSHLHFYLHDTLNGKSPSAVRIAGLPNSTFMNFTNTMIADDPLTGGPKPTSKLVGRAQGVYAMAAKNDVALLTVLNFAFLEGKHNGSSISIVGRNHVFDAVREMPIIGGSGLFRFARGYALANTFWVDSKTGDAIVEYNLFVWHF